MQVFTSLIVPAAAQQAPRTAVPPIRFFLPFHLQDLGGPITYRLSPEATKVEIDAEALKLMAGALLICIKLESVHGDNNNYLRLEIREAAMFGKGLSALSVALSIGAIVNITSLQPAFAQDRSENTSGTFKGIVAPARSYDVAPPFDGQVIKIHFIPGQFVEKGALLFTLDTTKEELELDRDRARLLRAEAKHRVAEAILKSNTELRKKNVISDRQFVELEASRDVAAADLAEAQVQVRADQVKIKELKRYAPFAGIMSRATVAEGAHLIRQARENTGMATITELDPIQVRANVPYEVYADHLKLLKLDGKTLDRREALDRIEVFVTLANGEKLPQVGRISGGGYEFDPKTQEMEVMVEFPNPGLLLRPGLAVTLTGRLKPN